MALYLPRSMISTGEQQQQQQEEDSQHLRRQFEDVWHMVHRGRSSRLRLAGKLQQLQADLAGPVGQRNRSLADGLHRELAQLWPRRPKRVVQLAREHVVKGRKRTTPAGEMVDALLALVNKLDLPACHMVCHA